MQTRDPTVPRDQRHHVPEPFRRLSSPRHWLALFPSSMGEHRGNCPSGNFLPSCDSRRLPPGLSTDIRGPGIRSPCRPLGARVHLVYNTHPHTSQGSQGKSSHRHDDRALISVCKHVESWARIPGDRGEYLSLIRKG